MLSKLRSLSIRTQFAILLLILVASCTVLIVYVGMKQRREAISQARADCLEVVNTITAEQQAVVRGAEQLATALALLPEVRLYKRDAVTTLLADLVKKNPQYTSITITDNSGMVWASSLPFEGKVSLADRRYFQQAVRTGMFSSGEYVMGRMARKGVISFAHPVKDTTNRLTGVVIVVLDLECAQKSFENVNLPPGGSFSLLDHRGVIFIRNLNDPLSRELVGKVDPRPETFARMQKGPDEGQIDSVGNDGRFRIGAYRKLRLSNEPEPYMYVRAGMPLAEVTAKANAATAWSLAFLALLFGAGLFLVWFAGKRLIVNPVALLKKASEQVKIGPEGVNVSRIVKNGELGDLARAFDDMAGSLVAWKAALRKSEQRWATTLASVGDAVIVTDTDGRVTFMNPIAEEVTGWTLERAKQRPITEVFQIVNEHTRNEVENPVDRVLREGTVVGLANHTILIRKDGSEVPIDDSGAPVRDLDGTTTGVVLVFRNIMQRRAQENHTNRLASFPELDPIPILEVDLSGDITFCNPSVEKTLEELGMDKRDCSPLLPSDMGSILRDWDGTSRTIAREVTIKDRVFGETIHFVPQFNAVRIYCREITRRKRAEQALQKAYEELELRVHERTAELHQAFANLSKERQRLYDVLESLPAYVALLGPDYRMPFVNRVFRDLFGDPGEKKCFEHLFGRTEPCGTCYTYETLKTSKPQSWQWTGPDRRIYDIHDFPFADSDGSPLILEMGMDITDRKRIEEEIRIANAYNRSLIEASVDPLATIDPEGKITDVNTATEKATGYGRDELIGTDFSDYFTESQKARASYLQVFTKGLVRDYPLEIRHRDGHITPVLYNASVYRDEEGKVAGVFAAARDISERRKLEEELRQTQKMESLGTLTGGIAHDFNNILAGMIGFTEMALDDIPPDSPARHHLELVLKSGFRARDLIRQMLSFSRKASYEIKAIPLTPIIKETVKLLRASIPTTIVIGMNVATNSDTILANATGIQQIIMNLATNAAHAMREKGGKLTITLKDAYQAHDRDLSPGAYLELVVEDTGAGMDTTVMERIFDPFFTTKEPGQGTGMGLAVVYGIVKSFNAEITVQSVPGEGSTFRVLLPKAVADEPSEASTSLAFPTGHEKILFVDDEQMLTELGKNMLERLGYAVTTMTSSSEALKLFYRDPFHFDLVITDQTMPELTGLRLAEQLLTVRSDLPIILCTGHSDSVNVDSATAAGIRGLLLKPLAKYELAVAVRKALDAKTGE
ncbi:MAG TPA: PAS domain S-box protein [Syntrophorhabdaceae bacterium]|nr:PAS domain S-box protein [Syntrophorhabdaceae bacterium]